MTKNLESLGTRLFVLLLLLTSAIGARGEFVAFNDHAPGSGTFSNATTWNILGTSPGAGGALKDIVSGLSVPVSVSIKTNGPVVASGTAGDPSPGTPLYNTFFGYVDFKAASRNDSVIQIPTNATVTYTFTGLNTNKVYSFKGSAVRGGSGDTYLSRWTLIQLADADSWVNAHTSGCYTNGLDPSSVAINTGINTSGDMADWELIKLNKTGSLTVTCTQYTGPIPTGTADGSYAYALTGFRLEEFGTGTPALASAAGTDTVTRVTFTVPVAPQTATNTANYVISNSYGKVSVSKAILADPKTVLLTASNQIPFSVYTITVSNIADALTGSLVIAPNSKINYTNIAFTAGYVKAEFWTSISGNTLSSLTNNSRFPNSPNSTTYYPDSGYQNSLGANYGARMSGYIEIPADGSYAFGIYGGVTNYSAGTLFISTNGDPRLKMPVVNNTLIPLEDLASAKLSSPLKLQGGQHCYYEALLKEGANYYDVLYLIWTNSVNPGLMIIPYAYCGNYITANNATVTLTRQPSSTNVYTGRSAVLVGQATCSSTIVTTPSYQWQRNGVDIPGATSTNYTTPRLDISNNGDQYRLIAYVPGAVKVSAPATITVSLDQIPPTVVQARNFGQTHVQITYSEQVDPVTASSISNYVTTNLAILGVSIDSSNTTVTLLTEPMVTGTAYSLVINGVYDQASPPNMIATNTTVVITAAQPNSIDIGGGQASVTTLTNNSVVVSAFGSDIGGTSDQFNFNSQICSGDFDVQVRVAGLSPSDVWAKAGLMARETTTPGSAFAAVFSTPVMNGSFFEYRDRTGNAANNLGAVTVPINFPYNWLRLTRSGSVFSGYASYDGNVWTSLGSAFIQVNNLLYVGFATCGHSSTTSTSAQFADYTYGTSLTLGRVEKPQDDLGPSSRRTPIAFSEIMFKPAPRTDNRNLEFIEIYNSNPWFHDISGYRIVSGSMSYTFPPKSIIQGGAFLVVAASPRDISELYGATNIVGPYTGSLKKADTLNLLDEKGKALLTVPYSTTFPWPVAADGTGHSIVLANPTYGEADPRAWDISDAVGGTPGKPETYRPDPRRNVVINEVLAHTRNPAAPDYIELYNHGSTQVDLSGCILTDDPALSRFTIPNGTTLGAGRFVSFDRAALGFGLSALGQTVYLFNPDKSRVLDALQYEAQAEGVSFGRWPDGANALYPLAAQTPGAPNGTVLIRDIVINEIMYHPISGNDDDQFIELYNKGTNTVSLANWEFTSGITFTFPTNAQLAPNAYLVIARNQSNLLAHYPNLNTANTLGNFGGKLSHDGERLALSMPQLYIGTNTHGVFTNTILVVADEITYGTGGRWGQWSDGGGSSLELTDPRSNHRLAANWADSDDTQKSKWVNIEATGAMDNGQNYSGSTVSYAQIGPLDVGECLVDNIEIYPPNSSVNAVRNSTFESGLDNWSLDGCMTRSSLEDSGYSSALCLHIRCSERLWTGANSCQLALNSFPVALRQNVTMRFKARWLRGTPEVLMRLNGNWVEATGAMPIPLNLGTPGARNSTFVANAGPAIYDVTHFPTVPTGADSVIVTAKVHDPDGIKRVTLHCRYDSTTSWYTNNMNDAGINGDAVAGDGIYTAQLPWLSQVVPFFISVQDSKGKTNRFPQLVNDNGPERECLVRWSDPAPGGSFGVYHYWLSQDTVDRWSSLPNLSNESHDGTLVSGKRVIYNMQGRFAGSPYHQNYYSPVYQVCHYKWNFPSDDKFHGVTSYNKMHAPGNGPGDDNVLQREQTANTLLRALGVPWVNRRFVALYINGYRPEPLMEDAQCPGSDMIDEYFPDDNNGYLYKMQPWFEFSPDTSYQQIGFINASWCSIMPFTTTGGAKKTAAYRYTFLSRRTPDSASNYTNVFALVDAANTRNQDYVANVENVADMENFMRVFAANHAAGNWDSYGARNAQNLYGYSGTKGTKYSLMMFDFNIVFGNSGSSGPGQNLFEVNAADSNTGRFFTTPEFRRMYWRAMQELINGPLDVNITGPLVDAKYNAFLANNVSATSPAQMKSWLTSARSSISSQLAAENKQAFAVTSTVLFDNTALVYGDAPVNVKTILINGVEYPVLWTGVGTWRITVPLKPGQNALTVQPVDIRGNPLGGASTVAMTYPGDFPSPVGHVVFSEIMYKPLIPGAQFIELYNNTTNITYDLSGWSIDEIGYTFPQGATIKPGGCFTLANSVVAFNAAYGAKLISGFFDSPISDTACTLTLTQPGIGPEQVVAKVRYENVMPWSVAANGTGSSLQLIDSTHDTWRVCNWTSIYPPKTATPSQTNSTFGTLPPLPQIWINEIQAENLTGITTGAGQHAGWIELFNPTTNAVPLDGVSLANSYDSLAQWTFPAGLVINPGEFKLIFADGRTDLSTPAELHASFVLAPGAGCVVASWQNPNIDNIAPPLILDYVNYSNLGANHSWGSYPDGQSFDRKQLFFATPGALNNGNSTALTVVINEYMAGNTHTIANPIGGKYDDWFELYNYGDKTVDLTGCFLTHTDTDPREFTIPAGYSIPPKGLLLVWADKKDTNGTRDLHVNFKLNKDGSSIGLYATNGTLVDFVTFGIQTSDISQGRFPDGNPNIYKMKAPTPGTPNTWINSSPVLATIANRTITLGQIVSFVAKANDPDSPPQYLTYSLGAGSPPDATIDPYTGFFMWRPTEVGTNLISVVASDSGFPSLCSTQYFAVVVLPLPQFEQLVATPELLTLSWKTIQGQTYDLQYKSDLSWPIWISTGTRVVGNGELTKVIVTLNEGDQRYYRLAVVQ